MSLKEIIESTGVVQELLEIEDLIKIEKTILDNYVKNRFPKNQNLEDNVYSDELKDMFLQIKKLPQEFQLTINEEIRHILKSRSALQSKDELTTLKSIIPMLGAHFQTYEIDKLINRMVRLLIH